MADQVSQSIRMSIVVAGHNAAPAFEACLGTLVAQAQEEPVEIIVAESSSDGTADLIRQKFPSVRVLHFDDSLGLPQLRGYGIAEALGEIIAILDPYCRAADGWLRGVLDAHGSRLEAAIGGAVELDLGSRPTLGNWATYLSEYASFMPPLPEGVARELAGSNIAYKRWALGSPRAMREQGFWKTALNARLQSAGQRLWATPRCRVRLHKPVPVAEFTRSRFHHGRCFAAMRVAGAGLLARTVRAVTTPALPAVALWRRWRAFWPKRCHRSTFLLAMPLLVVFDVSWAWGELWGYLLGPKRSCRRLFY